VTRTASLRRLLRLADIPLGEGRGVVVDGEELAVFRCGETVRVVGNRCPHAGGPLADGIVAGDTVTCPLHGRVVDLRTGAVTDCEQGVRVHRAEVVDGEVLVAFDDS
jgi:nitrite reductase (NADH) small subunit